MFLLVMAHGFGYHSSDVAGLVSMLLAVAYFAAALATCFPQFPVVLLGRFGAILHLFVMPIVVVSICGALGSGGTVYLLSGLAFAALWFVMARSITHSVP